MANRKNIKRSLKKAFKKSMPAVEFAGEVAANWLPGVNLATKGLRYYYEKRTNERIAQFHKLLLNGNPNGDLSQDDLTEADFYSLLQACISDIDEKKVQAYANLTIAIASKRFDSSLFHKAIFTLKEISWDDLEALKKVYITNRFSVGYGSTTESPHQPKDFMRQDDDAPMTMTLSVANLKAKGLLDSDNISRFGIILIDATYTIEQITSDQLLTGNWTKNRWTLIQIGSEPIPGVMGEALIPEHVNKIVESMHQHMKIEKIFPIIAGNPEPSLPYTNCFVMIGPKSPDKDMLDKFLNLTKGLPTIQIKILDKERALIGEHALLESDEDASETIEVYPPTIPVRLIKMIDNLQSTPASPDLQT